MAAQVAHGVRPSSGAAMSDYWTHTIIPPSAERSGPLRPGTLHLARNSKAVGRAGIPKGFRNKAQGCEQRAPLGKGEEGIGNPHGIVALEHDEYRHKPDGVVKVCTIFSQGSSLLATLGWRTESLWDSPLAETAVKDPLKVQAGTGALIILLVVFANAQFTLRP